MLDDENFLFLPRRDRSRRDASDRTRFPDSRKHITSSLLLTNCHKLFNFLLAHELRPSPSQRTTTESTTIRFKHLPRSMLPLLYSCWCSPRLRWWSPFPFGHGRNHFNHRQQPSGSPCTYHAALAFVNNACCSLRLSCFQ